MKNYLRAVLATGLSLLLVGCPSQSATKISRDGSPPDFWTAEFLGFGVRLVRDPEGGCQYLKVSDGGITPRLAPDGFQVCDRRGSARAVADVSPPEVSRRWTVVKAHPLEVLLLDPETRCKRVVRVVWSEGFGLEQLVQDLPCDPEAASDPEILEAP